MSPGLPACPDVSHAHRSLQCSLLIAYWTINLLVARTGSSYQVFRAIPIHIMNGKSLILLIQRIGMPNWGSSAHILGYSHQTCFRLFWTHPLRPDQLRLPDDHLLLDLLRLPLCLVLLLPGHLRLLGVLFVSVRWQHHGDFIAYIHRVTLLLAIVCVDPESRFFVFPHI